MILNVFVNYEQVRANGGLLRVAHDEEVKGSRESSDVTSDEEEEKEETKEEKDVEETEETREPKFFMHKYTVDIIAEYKDREEELVMHWALGKKSASEWARPDDNQLPKDTTRFKDNIAC